MQQLGWYRNVHIEAWLNAFMKLEANTRWRSFPGLGNRLIVYYLAKIRWEWYLAAKGDASPFDVSAISPIRMERIRNNKMHESMVSSLCSFLSRQQANHPFSPPLCPPRVKPCISAPLHYVASYHHIISFHTCNALSGVCSHIILHHSRNVLMASAFISYHITSYHSMAPASRHNSTLLGRPIGTQLAATAAAQATARA